MMLRLPPVSLAFVVASAALVGCSDTTTQSAPSAQMGDLSADQFLTQAENNARSFGARTTRIGDDAAVVTYQGASKGFVSCAARRGADYDDGAALKLVLDTRTRLVVTDSVVDPETVYIATVEDPLGTSGTVSTTFSDSEGGKLTDDVTCRSTGLLERRILGQG